MIHTLFFWTFLLSHAVLSSSVSPLSSTHCPTLREQGKIVQSLIYNRVTKTASSTMGQVVKEAQATNGFKLLNLPTSPHWRGRDMPTIVVHDKGASHLCTQKAVARDEKYFCVRNGKEKKRKIVIGHLGHDTVLRLLGPSLVNNTAVGHMNIVRHPVLREQSSFNYMLGRRTCNGHNSLKMNTSSACCCRLTIYRECVKLWEANRCKLEFSSVSNSQAYFLGRRVRDYTMVGLTEALPQSIELMADLFPNYFGHVDLSKHGIPHAKISDKAEDSALSIEVTQLLLRQASTQEELDLYALTVYRFWNTYMSCKPQYQSWREAMRSAWAEGMLSLHGLPAIAPGVEELLYSDMMKRIAKLEAIQQGT